MRTLPPIRAPRRGGRSSCIRAARLLAILLVILAACPASAQIYNYTANVSVSWGYFMTNGTANARVYVPEHVTQPLGAIIVWNGDGEDRRYMTAVGWFQQIARAMNYAIIACEGAFTLGYHIAATQNTVNGLLSGAAAASGRPALANAPVFALGNSRGGIVSIRCAKHYPSRMLGFAASKGIDYDYWWNISDPPNPADGPYPPGGYQVPGVWVPGETDANSVVSSYFVQQSFQDWRNQGALSAFAMDYNVGHSDMEGQFHDLAAILLRELHALRHPGTPPSSTPGNPLPLGSLNFSSGWLGERPLLWMPAVPNNYTAGKFLTRPAFPQIAAVGQYSGNATQASWLPSELMALAYRAHMSTDPFNAGRNESPRQSALQLETPARFQRFRATDPIRISADPREWTGVTKVEFYLNAAKLGEKTDGDWTWDVTTNPGPGIHAVIVVAEDAAGRRQSAYAPITIFDPLSGGNFTNTWTGLASSSNIQDGGNWSGGNSSWQVVTSGSESAIETRQLFICNGSSRNGQGTLSTGSMTHNPSILGFRFLNASGSNAFNIAGWRRIYLGGMGITNLDADTQTFNNAQLFLNGSQTWDAAAGPLVFSNPSNPQMSLIRLGSRGTFMPRLLSESSVLTITGNFNTTINAPIDGNGAIIKEGNGALILNGNNTFADSDWTWTPAAQHETVRVHRGTVQLGQNGTLAPTTRLFIADHPSATFDANGRPLVLGSLNGAGTFALGANGSLTLEHEFVKYVQGNQTNTIWQYVYPSRFRGRITGGAPGATVLTLKGGAQNLGTFLTGNSSFAGRVFVQSGNLTVGHSNALGAAGSGNETTLANGAVLYISGEGLNIPETIITQAVHADGIVNDRGNNTLSGPVLCAPTSSGTITTRIRNLAPGSVLTLTGGISSNTTSGSSTVLRLEPLGSASQIHVAGGIADGLNGGQTRVVISSFQPPVISVTDNTYNGNGTGTFAGTPILSGGQVVGVSIVNGGSGFGYDTGLAVSPIVQITGGGGRNARLAALVGYQVTSVTVSGGGSGYVSPPSITFHGDGSGANASFTIMGGTMVNATVTNPGSGYTQIPTYTLSGGGPGNGEPTAHAALNITIGNGTVTGFTVLDGGFGYTAVPDASVRLSGVSSYTLPTQVARGILLVGSDAPASGNGALGSSSSGAVLLGRSSDTAAADHIALLTDGPVTIGRGVTINNINTSGNITVGGNSAHQSFYTGSISINNARTQLALTAATGGHVVISGQISGGASSLVLTKTGPGTVTLARSSGNTYNGQTTVAEGALLVTNTTGSATGGGAVTVQNGARLGGTGIINGSVTLQPGAALAFDLVTPPASHDRLDIGGALALNGNPIDLASSNSAAANGAYVLVQAASITGAPGPVTAPPGFAATAAVIGNQLVVTLGPALSPLEQWRQTHFGSPANSGNGADTADPDGDGVPNLLEYALGGTPTDPASRPLPAVGTTVVSGQNRLTLTFTPQVVTGLTYIVQASTDLSDWTDQTDLTGLLTPGQPFTFTDSANLGTTPRRFLRLRVASGN